MSQLTIHDIPAKLEQALRRRAKAEGKSLNELIVSELRAAASRDAGSKPKKVRDLSDLVGKSHFDKRFHQALEDFAKVDPPDWQ